MSCGAKERDFSFWMPVELVRSGENPRIGGVASDETAQDLQGEKVMIDGLDISYLTQRGTFNWDHGKNPGDIVGEIDTAKKMIGDKKQLYVEGFLYPKVQKAKEIVNLLDSLKDSNSGRKLGLSLEGRIRERDGADGKVVKKAWIRNVAVTYHPINQGTWVDFVKSLGANVKLEKCTVCPFDCPAECPEKEPIVKSEEVKKEVEVKAVEVTKSDEQKEDIRQDVVSTNAENTPSAETVEKADSTGMGSGGGSPTGVGLSAGHDNPTSSGGISGSALRRQSLEKDKKVTTYDDDDLKKKKKKVKKSDVIDFMKGKGFSDNGALVITEFLFKVAEQLPKEYTKSEIVDFLKSTRGYSDGLADKMADFIFKAVEVAGYLRTRKGHLEHVGSYSKMSSAIQHELMRIGTMSDKALATRAGKIGHSDKLLHFYAALKEVGKDEIAGVARMQGRKIGLKDSDFDQVRVHAKPFIEERVTAS